MGEEDIVGKYCLYRWMMRLSQAWMEISVKYASKRVC